MNAAMTGNRTRIKSRSIRESADSASYRNFAAFLPPNEDFEDSAVEFRPVESVTVTAGGSGGKAEYLRLDYSGRYEAQSAVDLGVFDLSDREFWEYCAVEAKTATAELVLHIEEILKRIADFADGDFWPFGGRKFKTEAEFGRAFVEAAEEAGFRLSVENGKGVIAFDHKGRAGVLKVKVVFR